MFQGTRAPTLDKQFMTVASGFYKKYLLKEKGRFSSILALIAFFKDHPSVNEQILDYAVTTAIFANSKKMAKDIPSPLEVIKQAIC